MESRKDRLIYAFFTVLITVPCFVFYCLSIEKGGLLKVDYKFALLLIPIEFILAFLSEVFVGSPLSAKLALKTVSPKEYKPVLVETAIICSTVCIMCPLMSFLATILYKGLFPVYYFHQTITLSSFLINFIPNFLQTFVLNFPFALLSQLFFIQPFMRRFFKILKKTFKF